METKNSNEVVLQKCSVLEMKSQFLVPPHSVGGGGLALFWSDEVIVDVLNSSDNFIDTSISFQRKKFFITFTYGSPDISKRKEVWERISAFGCDRDIPWLLTGDFNDITENSEKVGGPTRPESSFCTFRTFLSENGLWDLKHSGNFLSWRGQRGPHFVLIRLDRTIINGAWIDMFASSWSEYLRFEGSDHRPLMTYLGAIKKRKKIFRYDRRLKDKEEVRKLIREVWLNSHDNYIEDKLSSCRDEILSWVKEHHFNSLRLICKLKEKLDLALSSTCPNDTLVADLNLKLSKAYLEEEAFWKNRSRLLWLALGDKNTSFFHASTKARAVINKLSVLEDDDGLPHYEDKAMGKLIQDYFHCLFTSSGETGSDIVNEALRPCVDSETNESLIAVPSGEEIYQAVKDTHPDKAPGPDGFSACFYQAHWDTVGEDVIKCIQEFFIMDHLPESLCHTYVRLIPKGPNPQQVKDYRPIALCNVLYKFISKILANRLKPLLERIISVNQSAFVAGRAISDNVLITHEVLYFLQHSKAKKRCHMAVKTDMSKAYDRLEWSFIIKVFERFGFHEKWLKWISWCISSVSYEYLVNEEALGKVIPTRGIRQGDPLSPYIFILCGEVLSGLCKKAAAAGKLKGIKIAHGAPRIDHLLFADDTMLFCRADEQNCTTLREILRRYEIASGQQINPSKSTITFSAKTPGEIRDTCKRILGISKEGGVGKYLGLPESFGRKKRDVFASIVDRVKQRIMSWSTKFLSSAGRLVLLKSVLAAIPNYSMSCFKLPLSLCKKIQSLITRFWWDGNSERKKMCWVSWKRMMKSKGNGGLGFRDIQLFNDALLAKHAWRLIRNPESLLARMLKAKYFNDSKFIDAKPAKKISHGWRGILIGLEVIKKGSIHAIGNGKETRVWHDNWLAGASHLKPVGPPAEFTVDLLVRDLMTDSGEEWDIAKIDEVLPAFRDQIISVKQSITEASDKVLWMKTKDGLYSSRSGYYTLTDEAADMPTKNYVPTGFKWRDCVWNLECPPKIKLFLWKIFNDALPVGSSLAARGVVSDLKCPRCGEEETMAHVFFHCSYAQRTWDAVHWKVPINLRDSGFVSTLQAVLKLKVAPPYGITSGPFAPWLLWSIWKSRNFLCFQNRAFSPHETVLKGILDAKEWASSQAPKSTASTGTSSFKNLHNAPSRYNNVFFTDTAWDENSRCAGLGLVQAKEPQSMSFSFVEEHVVSPVIGECLAIRAAVRKAIELELPSLHIFSDSKICVDAFEHNVYPQEIYGITQDIRNLSTCFASFSLSFCPRSQNLEADRVAKSALSDFLLDRNLRVRD